MRNEECRDFIWRLIVKMLTFKLNTLLIFCKLDPQLGTDCSGTADGSGAPAARISRGPKPCRTVRTSIPLLSCFLVKTGVIPLS